MLKLIVVGSIVFSSLASSCSKEDKTPEMELSCLDKLQEKLLDTPPQLPALSIWEYQYNGATVYLVPAPCCDQFNPLYTLECEVLCHPDGGITGKGDGKCNDFHNTASDKQLVWTDKRSIK